MSDNTFLVSIICLCYNHENYVYDALNSVINQNYSNIEIIICDDASNDNSSKTIHKWITDNPNEKIIFIENKENLGPTKSFNNALKKATGNFILDFATDDILLPNGISKQIETFKSSKEPNLGIVYGNVMHIDENTNFIKYHYDTNNESSSLQSMPTGNIFINLLEENIICPTAILSKKEVYDYVGGYDDNLAYEDLDFWLKSSRKYSFDYVNEVVMQKRELTSSLSNDFYKSSSKGKRIRRSTYKILKKTLHTLHTKRHLKAILKRIHYEFGLNLKTKDFSLAINYIYLKAIVHLKILLAFKF